MNVGGLLKVTGQATHGNRITFNTNQWLLGSRSDVSVADTERDSATNIIVYRIADKNGAALISEEAYFNQDGSRDLRFNGRNRANTSWRLFLTIKEYANEEVRIIAADSPSASVNDHTLITAKWANEAFVHKSGDETIVGKKTFAQSIFSSANPMVRSTNWDGIGVADTSRAESKQKIIGQVTDKDGKRFIGIEVSADTDGSRWVHINGRNREDTWWTSLVKFGEKADGSIVGFLGGSPVTSSDDNSIATTAWVRALFEAGLGSAIPSGVAFPYAGKTVPSGFMACNGGTISRTTYAKLFAAIGTAWGAGDGSTTFKLPDWRNRTVMGANNANEVGTYLRPSSYPTGAIAQ